MSNPTILRALETIAKSREGMTYTVASCMDCGNDFKAYSDVRRHCDRCFAFRKIC